MFFDAGRLDGVDVAVHDQSIIQHQGDELPLAARHV